MNRFDAANGVAAVVISRRPTSWPSAGGGFDPGYIWYGRYDPQLLDTVHQVLVPPLPSVAIPERGSASARVATKPAGLQGVRRAAKGICDLKVGDVLVEAAQAYDGTFLLTAGQVVTTDVITRLKEWDRNRGVREPLIVAPR